MTKYNIGQRFTEIERTGMRSFLEGLGIIIALLIGWIILAANSPNIAQLAATAIVLTLIVSLFKPIPRLGLERRRFSVALLVLVGLPISLASLGISGQAARMIELKNNNPDAYLAELKDSDQERWLEELAEINPQQHEEELSKINAENARKKLVEEEARQRAKIEAEAASAAKAAEAVARREKEQAGRISEYIKQLDREISSIPSVRTTDYTKTVDDINLGVVLIGTWTLIYEKGKELPLDSAGQQKRKEFRNLIVRKQAEMFPILRDAYGPAMRTQLWEADGSARTFGTGYRTVEFINVAFARNANIKQIHQQMVENLMLLRFNRAQYKWFKEASEYSFYTLESPKDTDLVKWESGGRYRLLD